MRLRSGRRRGGGVLAPELDAGALGEEFERVAELEAFHFHYEINVAPPPPAPEAMPNLARGGNDERGGFLGAERTGRFPIHPGLLEGEVGLNELDGVEPVLDVFERRRHVR